MTNKLIFDFKCDHLLVNLPSSSYVNRQHVCSTVVVKVILAAALLLPLTESAIFTYSAILHRNLLTVDLFCLASGYNPDQFRSMPFSRWGGGAQFGRGERRAEWQMLGEHWASYWLTAWKLNTSLRSCLTVGVSLLPWGRGPVYWPTWYPSPSQSFLHRDFSWTQTEA